MPARMDSYLEKPGDGGGARRLSHVSVYERNGGFAVEEVVGEIDEAGHRRGRIVIVAEGLSLEDAEHRYHEARIVSEPASSPLPFAPGSAPVG